MQFYFHMKFLSFYGRRKNIEYSGIFYLPHLLIIQLSQAPIACPACEDTMKPLCYEAFTSIRQKVFASGSKQFLFILYSLYNFAEVKS